MNARSSGNLSKSLLIAGCGVVPLTAFLFQATPILIVTVALPFLSFVTELLLILFLLATAAGLAIGIEWLWTMFDDDRHRRRYWRERRAMDLEERKQLTPRNNTTRFTGPSLPVPSRQPRTSLRHSTTRRIDS